MFQCENFRDAHRFFEQIIEKARFIPEKVYLGSQFQFAWDCHDLFAKHGNIPSFFSRCRLEETKKYIHKIFCDIFRKAKMLKKRIFSHAQIFWRCAVQWIDPKLLNKLFPFRINEDAHSFRKPANGVFIFPYSKPEFYGKRPIFPSIALNLNCKPLLRSNYIACDAMKLKMIGFF